MPRVVPSQVVELIDKLFPSARNQAEGQEFVLSIGNSNQLAAILDLTQQIPPELLVINSDQYAESLLSG